MGTSGVDSGGEAGHKRRTPDLTAFHHRNIGKTNVMRAVNILISIVYVIVYFFHYVKNDWFSMSFLHSLKSVMRPLHEKGSCNASKNV